MGNELKASEQQKEKETFTERETKPTLEIRGLFWYDTEPE
jgi:hypothetical protein